MQPEKAMNMVPPELAEDYGPWSEAPICHDCFYAVTPVDPDGYRIGFWHWYMVHDYLWEQAGMTRGFLCLPCLEDRLGRDLEAADFPDLPVNRELVTLLTIGTETR